MSGRQNNTTTKSVLLAVIILFLTLTTLPANANFSAPTLNSPKNNSYSQDAYVPLITNVTMNGSGTLTVDFYDADTDKLIDSVEVPVNGSATASTVWKRLSFATHRWYAVASDGTTQLTSDVFVFDTGAAAKPTTTGERYITNSSGGLSYSTLSNTTEMLQLIVAPFVDVFGVWFYALIVFLFVGLVFLKTQTAFLPSLILLFASLTMYTLLPVETRTVFLGMMVLGFTGIVFSLFGRRV